MKKVLSLLLCLGLGLSLVGCGSKEKSVEEKIIENFDIIDLDDFYSAEYKGIRLTIRDDYVDMEYKANDRKYAFDNLDKLNEFHFGEMTHYDNQKLAVTVFYDADTGNSYIEDPMNYCEKNSDCLFISKENLDLDRNYLNNLPKEIEEKLKKINLSLKDIKNITYEDLKTAYEDK